MYDPSQPQLQPYKPKNNFLGNLDGQGRIRTDESGALIPAKQRISWEDYMKNPYGKYGAGNAIDPRAPMAPNFLQSYGGAVANPNNPITAILGGGMPTIRGASGW